jgi:histidinol dehydrogenase
LSRGNEFSNLEELQQIKVSDGELRAILERLALDSAESLDDRSTLKDIAELTELPVNSVARILADIRGDDELAILAERVDVHEKRITEIEKQRHQVNLDQEAERKINRMVASKIRQHEYQKEQRLEDDKIANNIVGFVVAVIAFIVFFVAFSHMEGAKSQGTPLEQSLEWQPGQSLR